MALLSAIESGSKEIISRSATSSIDGQTSLIILLVVGGLFLLGLITWLVINAITVAESKKKYYDKLREKLNDTKD